MATSQNGFRANDRSVIASYAIPGGKLALRKGDVATVLVYVAKRFHSEVEPLTWPGNWAYAERTIRGSSRTLSNHASGTAIDLNAPRHPLGVAVSRNFNRSQVAKIHQILRDCDGVVRWGGDYSGRKDAMHFEINKGTAAVRALARKIEAGKKPGPSGGATSSNGAGSSSSPTHLPVAGATPLVKPYSKGEPVKRIQKAVGVKIDGYYGPSTVKAVKAFQAAHGLASDGDVGPNTWKAILGGKVSKPKPKPIASSAPSFPLPKGHWYGPESRSKKNHSGYYSKDRAGIKQIQSKLGLKADGLYGAKTYAAVASFQRRAKIRVDGAVGSATWSKLF